MAHLAALPPPPHSMSPRQLKPKVLRVASNGFLLSTKFGRLWLFNQVNLCLTMVVLQGQSLTLVVHLGQSLTMVIQYLWVLGKYLCIYTTIKRHIVRYFIYSAANHIDTSTIFFRENTHITNISFATSITGKAKLSSYRFSCNYFSYSSSKI